MVYMHLVGEQSRKVAILQLQLQFRGEVADTHHERDSAPGFLVLEVRDVVRRPDEGQVAYVELHHRVVDHLLPPPV